MLLFYLGFIIGANISLILYACILVGKDSDKDIENKEAQIEWWK